MSKQLKFLKEEKIVHGFFIFLCFNDDFNIKKSERTNNSTSKLKTRKKLFGVIFKKPQPLFIQKTLTTLTLTLTFKL